MCPVEPQWARAVYNHLMQSLMTAWLQLPTNELYLAPNQIKAIVCRLLRTFRGLQFTLQSDNHEKRLSPGLHPHLIARNEAYSL